MKREKKENDSGMVGSPSPQQHEGGHHTGGIVPRLCSCWVEFLYAQPLYPLTFVPLDSVCVKIKLLVIKFTRQMNIFKNKHKSLQCFAIVCKILKTQNPIYYLQFHQEIIFLSASNRGKMCPTPVTCIFCSYVVCSAWPNKIDVTITLPPTAIARHICKDQE